MNNIKKLLKAKEMSRSQLSEKVGCSERHIYFLQNSERAPKIELAKKVAIALTGDDDIRKVWE